MNEILIIFILAVLIFVLLKVFRSIAMSRKLESIHDLILNKNYQTALHELYEFNDKQPDNPKVIYYLAECYYNLEEYDKAEAQFKRALVFHKSLNDSFIEQNIHLKLANIYEKKDDLKHAQEEYMILSRLEPNNYEAFFHVGKIFYERKLRERALPFLKKATDLNPKYADSHFLMGKIYLELHQSKLALISFIKSVKIQNLNYEAHYNIGVLFVLLDKTEEALKEFEFSERTKDLQLKTKAIFQKGLCKMKTNDWESAKVAFERALKYSIDEHSNTTMLIRYNLGSVYEQQGQFFDAVEQWEKVYAFRPQYEDVEFKLEIYKNIRVDENFKDILMSTPTTFEKIGQQIVKHIGYKPMEVKAVDKDYLEISASEKKHKLTGMSSYSSSKVFFVISRKNEEVTEDEISTLVHKTKQMHFIHLFYLTIGTFSPKAKLYSENRSVDLFDRAGFSDLMKNLRSAPQKNYYDE